MKEKGQLLPNNALFARFATKIDPIRTAMVLQFDFRLCACCCFSR